MHVLSSREKILWFVVNYNVRSVVIIGFEIIAITSVVIIKFQFSIGVPFELQLVSRNTLVLYSYLMWLVLEISTFYLFITIPPSPKY